MTSSIEPTYRRSTGLVDVLDRVLDKGLVVAGDIRVSLAEVELLTIRIRLLVCSIDKAEQIGLDWWRQDPNLSVAARRLTVENDVLREQVRALEERVASLALEAERPAPRTRAARSQRQKSGGK
ncbi:MAG TPA: gas vesicle protein [Thermoanaerobaculia bacterium]